jgi:hypothetical protein
MLNPPLILKLKICMWNLVFICHFIFTIWIFVRPNLTL